MKSTHSRIFLITSCLIALFILIPATVSGQYYIEYDAPGDSPFGMVWDGQFLWINDKSDFIYKVDISDSFVVVGKYYFNGWGDLAWDGTWFWEMGWSDLRQYQITDSTFTILWRYDYRPEFHHMAGIDWDGQYLWVSYNAGGFFRIDSSESATDIYGINDRKWKVAEFREGPPSDPWNFAFSDSFLWIADLRSRHLIQCARDSNFSYIDEYSLPGPSPTGIAWDGTYLWTCDDYTGKIYKHLQLTKEPLDPEDEILPAGSVATPLDGAITADMRLSIASSPYRIDQGLTVEKGATLTIDPGVRIFFAQNAGLVVNGTLKAIGKPDSLIVFSHQNANEYWGTIQFNNPDTLQSGRSVLRYTKIQYLDGIYLNGSNPEIRDNFFRFMVHLSGQPVPNTSYSIVNNHFYFSKLGIRLSHGRDEHNSRILIDGNTFFNSNAINIGPDFITPQYFEISNNSFLCSINSGHLAIGIQNSDGVYIHDNLFENCSFGVQIGHSRNIRIEKNVFRGPSVTAIDLAYNTADISVLYNSISDCQRQAILLFYNSEAQIHYNNFSNNEIALSLWSAGKNIDATYNWWGTSSPDSIERLIEDQKDDPSSGRVQFVPFLTSPVLLPSSPEHTIPSHVAEQTVPRAFLLLQNFPNPFNLQTTISYATGTDGHVRLIVYDALGRKVAVLVDRFQEAGSHRVTFNAKNLASGLYIYRIYAGKFSATRKMLILK
jgi:hypothetical protein